MITERLLKRGNGPKEINPTWPLGMLVTYTFLSHNILTGKPCWCWRSPWLKNSSKSKPTHALLTLKSRAKKDKSEECTHKSSAICWFSKFSSHCNWLAMWSLIDFIIFTCFSISVANITPATLRLTWFYCYSLSLDRKSVSCIVLRVWATWYSSCVPRSPNWIRLSEFI